MVEFLSYGFVQRGLLAGSLVAAACALLGVFLVLKRLSLIGDGMSHVCLTGVAVALLTSTSPVYMSLPVVALSSLGIMKLTQKFRIYGDAAIGIVSAAGLSVGLLITALAGGFNTDLLGYLFGSILTVTTEETVLCAGLLVLVGGGIFMGYRWLVATCFDEAFAHTRGVPTQAVNTVLVLVTSVAVVLSFKVVGIFLISALIIIPPVSALLISHTFKQVLWLAAVFGVGSVWVGIYASFVLNIPSGAAIILVSLIFLFACYVWSKGVHRG
ncbi:MAG: metal ABC transporter permease [Elusimicrobiaceae bacterium]|nr:metal ABC transporter permease [Elusimicrobiaceae bacterium]